MWTAFCPNCLQIIDYGKKIDSDLFHLGYPIKCDNCSYQFNIFEILRYIAINIDGGKDVISESADVIFSPWKIMGGTSDEHDKVGKFMSQNMSDVFLKEIINDCLMWGTCFIKHIIINDEFKLEVLDPCDYKITTEPVMSSYAYLGEKVKSVINYKTEEEIPKSNLFLLSLHHSGDIATDLGFTILGYWFTTWLRIHQMSSSISKMSSSDPQYETFQNFLNLTKEGTQHQSIERLDGGRNSRETLSHSIENQIFSTISPRGKETIAEKMANDYISPPEIEFIKDSTL
jgi:hypothetical protein